MSSRANQIVQIKQKIERLNVQLEYLEKLDELEAAQSAQLDPKLGSQVELQKED